MVIARSPVRISFGGGGTDLPAYYSRFGGFVISAAITRYAYVVARRPATPHIQITSADYQISETLTTDGGLTVQEPLILPKAALEQFIGQGLRRKGVDLFMSADVPPGTGLGSSSAMSVSLLRALSTYLGKELSRKEAAEMACHLELVRLERPIGKQDQYASAFGGLNSIEFTSDGVHVTPLNLSRATVTALKSRLLLFSTGKTHDSAEILAGVSKRANHEAKPMVVDALHQIKELGYAMRDALLDGALDDFGHLLDLSWREKKRLSSRVSTSAIEEWYGAARDAGALGGKITGAGGGGYMMLYVPPADQAEVRRVMSHYGLRELTYNFDFVGAQIMTGPATRPVRRAAAPRLAPAIAVPAPQRMVS